MSRLRQWHIQLEEQSQRWVAKYESLSLRSKLFVLLYFLVNFLVVAAVILIGPAKIFDYLRKSAVAIQSYPFAPYVILAGFVLTSFPPLIGYGTLVTLCGFAYGVLWGWLLASAGCLLGSAVSFVVLGRIGDQLFKDWLSEQDHFRALSRALQRKGFSLLLLVRLCPFPFPYSNLFFASLPRSTVTLRTFLGTTLCITPKLLLHTFIGSRLFALTDPDAELDASTKAVNGVYIVVGSIIATGTGVYVYRITMREAAAAAAADQSPLLSEAEETEPSRRV